MDDSINDAKNAVLQSAARRIKALEAMEEPAAGSVIDVPFGKWCVYQHILSGDVIYIGKGSAARPYDFKDRNPLWHAVVGNSKSIGVNIVAWFDSEKEALYVEEHFIAAMRPKANIAVRLDFSLIERRVLREREAERERQADIEAKKSPLYLANLELLKEYWSFAPKAEEEQTKAAVA